MVEKQKHRVIRDKGKQNFSVEEDLLNYRYSITPYAKTKESNLFAIELFHKHGNVLLLVDTEYLLGKHASSVREGSRLYIDNEDDLFDILLKNIPMRAFLEGKEKIVLSNVDTGIVVGEDGLVEIIYFKTKKTNGSPARVVVKDAKGRIFDGILEYIQLRKESDAVQPVVLTDMRAPETTLLNLVFVKVDLNDPRSDWLEKEKLAKYVDLEKFDNAYLLLTIFPGRYAPSMSKEVDEVLGISGDDFWADHALLKNV